MLISSYDKECRQIMTEKFKRILVILALTIIPTFLIWLPFFVRFKTFWNIPLPQAGMATIVSNYDGPLYLAVAKTFYNSAELQANYQFDLPTEYYAAHFPLFPTLIKSVAGVLGFPYAMLFVTVLSSFIALLFFFKLASKFTSEKNALWLTVVFSILPARWLIVRSIGSPEPLFLASTLASLYYFSNKKYLKSGIWGMVSVLTKSPGILLFIALLSTIAIPHIKKLATDGVKSFIKSLNLKKTWALILIPVGLLIVFSTYSIILGDFFAYFKSGDNIHLFFPPFQIFNYSASWVGTFWLEEIIFIYLLGAIGVYKLKSLKNKSLYYYALIFYVSILFVSHRDIMRYALPITPLMLIAYKDTIFSKEFKIAFGIIIIPIFLYSLAFISQNSMQISNWAPFL